VKLRSHCLRTILALAGLALLSSAGLRADPEYPKMGPDIYDVHADASADIAAAIIRAGAEHKRVLLVFGANWCIWCHRLHATFGANAAVAAALDRGFVLVEVDVNTRKGEKRNAAVIERYGNPVQHGIPVLVVLDSAGNPLTTKDSGELEEGDGHSPAKILAFLATWAPAPRP
jgi:thiol:disulfide interchange protein